MSGERALAFQRYRDTWGNLKQFDGPSQTEMSKGFEAFIQTHPDGFQRESRLGHITGSALVVSSDRERVLLTLHRKLGLWIQLGGHSDGNPKTDEVALREAQEESGLEDLYFVDYGNTFGIGSPPPLILDLDIHSIPARRDEPEHLHYDIRYLIETKTPERIVISAESKDLKWFTFEEAYAQTAERSMIRQLDKLRFLCS